MSCVSHPGAVSIDFHMEKGEIYWTDILSDKIQKATIGSDKKTTIWTRETVVDHVHTPDGLALDWINDKLYWTGKCHL